jgi:hypothetical protein
MQNGADDNDASDFLTVGQLEDKDEAGAAHCTFVKTGRGHLHAPKDGLIRAVPRLKDNVEALMRLTESNLPPLRVVRPSQVVQVYCGFGDASGKQFGVTLLQNYNCRSCLAKAESGGTGVRFRIHLWSPEEEEVRRESSNYKELMNLVDTVGAEANAGRMQNCELFMFTDNSTAKSCFYRGTSKSRHLYLHRLVLRLRLLEMDYGMMIHVIHISGKRNCSGHQRMFQRLTHGRGDSWPGHAIVH